jgi:hypothetical protein
VERGDAASFPFMRPAFMAKLAMVLIQRLTTLKFGTRRWRKQH